MIITFWMYAYYLLDTPEYRVHLEARRLTEAFKLYTDYKKLELEIDKLSNLSVDDLTSNFNFKFL